ncbi:MAG: hypothetical protein CME38_09820 [Haliea sp.]|nr:hypothetical protein [Haliea sp.]
MTKTPISTLIEEGAPLTPSDWNEEKERQRLERLEQVRQRCARENSESPLWRARVERNPDYWKTFSLGGIK